MIHSILYYYLQIKVYISCKNRLLWFFLTVSIANVLIQLLTYYIKTFRQNQKQVHLKFTQKRNHTSHPLH